MTGRVQLVKVVAQSMITHTITCYSCPIALLKEIEKVAINFIQSGAINKNKLVLVAWNKMCRHIIHGGLGLRSLTKLNEATILKLCCDLLSSNED